jgi:hypothetical protein
MQHEPARFLDPGNGQRTPKVRDEKYDLHEDKGTIGAAYCTVIRC